MPNSTITPLNVDIATTTRGLLHGFFLNPPPPPRAVLAVVSDIINILLVALLFIVFALRMNFCHVPCMVTNVVSCSMSVRIGWGGHHVAWSGLCG